MNKWEPLRDMVMVKRLEPKAATASGIHFGNPKPLEDSTKGVVLACGPGRWVRGSWYKRGKWIQNAKGIWQKVGEWEWLPGFFEPMKIKPGMTVEFGPWADLLTLNDEIAIFPEADGRWIEHSSRVERCS